MATVVRPYRGVSADDRRADRRARLKEACLELIGAEGVVAVTAEAVSGRAGLTKRYFYESYGGRDALLHEMMDDFFVAVRSEILDALGADTEADAPGRAHIVARVLIDYLQGDSRQARLYVEAAGQPTLQARREEAFGEYTRMLVDAFPSADDAAEGKSGPESAPGAREAGPSLAGASEAGGGATGASEAGTTGAGASRAGGGDALADRRRTIAGLIIVAGTTQAAITWLQGGIDLPREDVIAEIARLILTAMSPGHG